MSLTKGKGGGGIVTLISAKKYLIKFNILFWKRSHSKLKGTSLT